MFWWKPKRAGKFVYLSILKHSFTWLFAKLSKPKLLKLPFGWSLNSAGALHSWKKKLFIHPGALELKKQHDVHLSKYLLHLSINFGYELWTNFCAKKLLSWSWYASLGRLTELKWFSDTNSNFQTWIRLFFLNIWLTIMGKCSVKNCSLFFFSFSEKMLNISYFDRLYVIDRQK